MKIIWKYEKIFFRKWNNFENIFRKIKILKYRIFLLNILLNLLNSLKYSKILLEIISLWCYRSFFHFSKQYSIKIYQFIAAFNFKTLQIYIFFVSKNSKNICSNKLKLFKNKTVIPFTTMRSVCVVSTSKKMYRIGSGLSFGVSPFKFLDFSQRGCI